MGIGFTKNDGLRTVNAISFAQIVRALADGPVAVSEIADSVGLSLEVTRKYVKQLWLARLCYIADYVPPPNNPKNPRANTCAYMLGVDQPDKKKRTKRQIAKEKHLAWKRREPEKAHVNLQQVMQKVVRQDF